MFKRLALALALCLLAPAAWAANPTCPTRPVGDSSNACASTAFVQSAITNGTVTPEDYGAKCDDVTIDTTALQAWLNALGGKIGGYIPPTGHACLFDAQLVLPGANGLSIFGAGIGASHLRYVGAATNLTTMVVGTTTGGCSQSSLTLRDFLLSSDTTMTGGAALLIQDVCGVRLQNLAFEDDPSGSYGNWYNGLAIHGGNQIYALNNTITGRNVPLILYGDDAGHSSTQLTDPSFYGGIIIGGVTGIDIAGNVGGASFDAIDLLQNKAQMKISQDLVALPNSQIFLGPRLFLDVTIAGGTGRGLDIQDPGGTSSLLSLSGTWIASSTAECFNIATGVQWVVNWTGGWLVNCGTDGLKQQSTAATVSIKDVTVWMTAAGFGGSTGYAFNCTVSNNNVWIKDVDLISWGLSGQFSSACNPTTYTSNSNPALNSSVVQYNHLNPTLAWQEDFSSQQVYVVADGGNSALPVTASGSITLTNQTNGDTAIYVCGGGACALSASSQATWVASTTTPAGGKASVAYDGSTGYRIYNNTGGSINVNVALVKTRNAN